MLFYKHEVYKHVFCFRGALQSSTKLLHRNKNPGTFGTSFFLHLFFYKDPLPMTRDQAVKIDDTNDTSNNDAEKVVCIFTGH